MIKNFIVRYFPFLGKFKRYGKAWYHHVRPVKKSYSQYAEDLNFWDFFESYNLKGSVYVDVGANHPSDISNSYLLYRKGLNGIIVEPNEELIKLFKRFRPRDVALAIGCSNENTILPFHISKTPVLSSFADAREVDVYKTLYLPVMRLDDALQHLKFDFISLLSIDVEGLNYEVLEGSVKTIESSLLICLEYDTAEDRARFSKFLGNRFDLLHEVGCNLLYVNKELAAKLQK
ncbi:MAG TPA: FkbM family methyltransferase [Puia sp.]|nr:FkbM family methyltransferase [Puia sp.]